mgnify:CR=1 FL=1
MHIKSLVFISNFLLTFLTNHVLEGCLVDNKNNAFYNTQYKTGTTNKGGFFPAGSDNVSIKGNTEKTKTR